MEISARVTTWVGPELPTEAAIRHVLETEGLHYERWSNGPLDVYFAHSHPFNKVIYVVTGAITFVLPTDGTRFTMQVGDRLDLPAGTMHEAVVSTLGVACFEAHY
jgi:quercetin dioxygenase-like cupin family protein